MLIAPVWDVRNRKGIPMYHNRIFLIVGLRVYHASGGTKRTNVEDHCPFGLCCKVKEGKDAGWMICCGGSWWE